MTVVADAVTAQHTDRSLVCTHMHCSCKAYSCIDHKQCLHHYTARHTLCKLATIWRRQRHTKYTLILMHLAESISFIDSKRMWLWDYRHHNYFWTVLKVEVSETDLFVFICWLELAPVYVLVLLAPAAAITVAAISTATLLVSKKQEPASTSCNSEHLCSEHTRRPAVHTIKHNTLRAKCSVHWLRAEAVLLH